MSANRAQRSPVVGQEKGGHSPRGGQGRAAKAAPAADAADPGEGTLGPVPPPLPSDPAVRAELQKRLERGLAQARAGIGEDWEVVHARVRARLNLPPL